MSTSDRIYFPKKKTTKGKTKRGGRVAFRDASTMETPDVEAAQTQEDVREQRLDKVKRYIEDPSQFAGSSKSFIAELKSEARKFKKQQESEEKEGRETQKGTLRELKGIRGEAETQSLDFLSQLEALQRETSQLPKALGRAIVPKLIEIKQAIASGATATATASGGPPLIPARFGQFTQFSSTPETPSRAELDKVKTITKLKEWAKELKVPALETYSKSDIERLRGAIMAKTRSTAPAVTGLGLDTTAPDLSPHFKKYVGLMKKEKKGTLTPASKKKLDAYREFDEGGGFKDLLKKGLAFGKKHIGTIVDIGKAGFDIYKALKEEPAEVAPVAPIPVAPVAPISVAPVAPVVAPERPRRRRDDYDDYDDDYYERRRPRRYRGDYDGGGSLPVGIPPPPTFTQKQAVAHVEKSYDLLKKAVNKEPLTAPQKVYLKGFAQSFLIEKQGKPGIWGNVKAVLKGTIAAEKAKIQNSKVSGGSIVKGGDFVGFMEDVGHGIVKVAEGVLSVAEKLGQFAMENPEVIMALAA